MTKGASQARRLRYHVRKNAETDAKIQADLISRLVKQDRSVQAYYEPAVLIEECVPDVCSSDYYYSPYDDFVSEILCGNGIPDYRQGPGAIGGNNWVEPVFPIDYVKHPECSAAAWEDSYCTPRDPCDQCYESSFQALKKKHPTPPIISASDPVLLDEPETFHPEQTAKYTTSGEAEEFLTPCYLPFENVQQPGTIAVPSLSDSTIEDAIIKVAHADDPYRLLQLLSDVEFLSLTLPRPSRRCRYTELRKQLRNKMYRIFIDLFTPKCSCKSRRRAKKKDDPTCVDLLAVCVADHLMPPQTKRSVRTMLRARTLKIFHHIHDGLASKALGKSGT